MTVVLFCVIFCFIIFYIYKLAKEKNILLTFGLIFLVEIIWMFLSAIYIDNGTYINEQGRTSYFTGASIRLILIYVPFLYFLPKFCKKSQMRNDSETSKFIVCHIEQKSLYSIFQIILFIVICYGMLDMLLTGIPLFSNTITRSNFFKYSKLPFASKIMGEVTFFLMFMNGKCFYEAKSTGRKLIAAGLFLLSIIHRLLMSYKYDGLYQIIFMFFLYSIYQWISIKSLKKIVSFKTIIKVIIVVSVLLLISYLFYDYAYKGRSALDMLLNRLFALQAHTWWGEDLKHLTNNDFGFNWEQISKEINGILMGVGPYDRETGIVKVMYDVVSSTVVESYLSQSLRFYGNFVTVAINCFGYLGTALYGIIVAKIIAYAITNFYSAVRNGEYLLTFISLSFLLDVIEYFRIGNFCLLLNLKTMIMMIAIISIRIIKKSTYKLKTRIF